MSPPRPVTAYRRRSGLFLSNGRIVDSQPGYDVRAIANPVEDLTTDAEYVAAFLNSLTGPVVLVGHPYKGSVISNAAAGSRKVKALVYVDAAAPDFRRRTAH